MTAVLACSMCGGWLMSLRPSGIPTVTRNTWSGPAVFVVATMLILGCAYSDLRIAHAVMFAISLGLVAIRFGAKIEADVDEDGSDPEPQTERATPMRFTILSLLPAIAATAWAIILFINETSAIETNPYDAYK